MVQVPPDNIEPSGYGAGAGPGPIQRKKPKDEPISRDVTDKLMSTAGAMGNIASFGTTKQRGRIAVSSKGGSAGTTSASNRETRELKAFITNLMDKLTIINGDKPIPQKQLIDKLLEKDLAEQPSKKARSLADRIILQRSGEGFWGTSLGGILNNTIGGVIIPNIANPEKASEIVNFLRELINSENKLGIKILNESYYISIIDKFFDEKNYRAVIDVFKLISHPKESETIAQQRMEKFNKLLRIAPAFADELTQAMTPREKTHCYFKLFETYSGSLEKQLQFARLIADDKEPHSLYSIEVKRMMETLFAISEGIRKNPRREINHEDVTQLAIAVGQDDRRFNHLIVSHFFNIEAPEKAEEFVSKLKDDEARSEGYQSIFLERQKKDDLPKTVEAFDRLSYSWYSPGGFRSALMNLADHFINQRDDKRIVKTIGLIGGGFEGVISKSRLQRSLMSILVDQRRFNEALEQARLLHSVQNPADEDMNEELGENQLLQDISSQVARAGDIKTALEIVDLISDHGVKKAAKENIEWIRTAPKSEDKPETMLGRRRRQKPNPDSAAGAGGAGA